MKTFRMRLYSALFALIVLPTLLFGQSAAPAPLNEESLADRTVYFFLDAECKSCALGDDFPEGKYWVVTGIRKADYATHAGWLDKFSGMLTAHFPQAKPLLEGLVFRFHFTAVDTEAFRKAQLERKHREGYQVIELDLLP